jgi:hypothetical protein
LDEEKKRKALEPEPVSDNEDSWVPNTKSLVKGYKGAVDRCFDKKQDFTHDEWLTLTSHAIPREMIVDKLLDDEVYKHLERDEITKFIKGTDKELFKSFRNHDISMA